MQHHPDESLSAFLDGDLQPAEAAAIESHVGRCAACRGRLEQLRALVATLGTVAEADPEWCGRGQRDLWPAIRHGMDDAGERRPSRTGLLAAAASLILLVGVSVSWYLTREPRPEPDGTRALEQARIEGYRQAIRDMEELIESIEDRTDPNSVRLVRGEMELLDAAIVEIRRALDDDPDNLWLRERLARSLRDKWTYLREAPLLTPPRFDPGG